VRRAVVVKLGSSTLVDPRGRPRRALLHALAGEIAALGADDVPVCVVSSGAIALGAAALGRGRPADVPGLQAASAVGQGLLLGAWQRALRSAGLATGQVLLTASDIHARTSYLNARATLETMLGWGVVPVVNENDSTATDEITFGDNDALAAQVAVLTHARLLVLLTDQEGLYTRDPRHAGAELVREVNDHRLLDELEVGGSGSSWGSGGMRSKVVAAEMASAGGVATVIAHGGTPGVVAAAIAGQAVGTRFRADERAVSSFKLWIRYGRPTAGRIEVDPGARKALERDGGSLLPVGVTGATGRFTTGDAVEIADPEGVVFARGLAEQPAAEVRRRAGQRGSDPAVHRDNLVLLRA
jgi:glutamate 5-kinase